MRASVSDLELRFSRFLVCLGGSTHPMFLDPLLLVPRLSLSLVSSAPLISMSPLAVILRIIIIVVVFFVLIALFAFVFKLLFTVREHRKRRSAPQAPDFQDEGATGATPDVIPYRCSS